MSRALTARLRAHCEALAACRRCGLGAEIRPILSEAATPRVMLVGQAPGKSEIEHRRPFSGRAGKSLFRWLATTGVDEPTVRRSIYIAAVTRCYPGPSPGGRGDRVPSPVERERCSEWLDAELEIIRPALVIPVGRLAIARFLGERPLDQLIGRRFTVTRSGRAMQVIPLPHPSGASSWIHQDGHAALLRDALVLLGEEFAHLGLLTPVAGGRPARSGRASVRRGAA